ncbi:hypothetical protein MGSAQ_000995 [marine sediment metagenome]|uniref:Uncharacterized protein n=1 Tax=marine sediment metagenome TaxID=412755 RepID=A0A1B6NVM7_9ZZZZ
MICTTFLIVNNSTRVIVNNSQPELGDFVIPLYHWSQSVKCKVLFSYMLYLWAIMRRP